MKKPKRLNKFNLIVIILTLLLIAAFVKIWELNSKVTRLMKRDTPTEATKLPPISTPELVETPERNLASIPEFVEAPKRNKEEKYEALKKLSVEVQINYFTKLLGSPLYINPVEGNKDLKEYVFVDDDFYVQTITNTNDKVYSYAIVSRKKDFNPTFEMSNLFKVSLNKTPFSEWLIGKDLPLNCYRFIGAHDPIYYFEEHYFGNPGLYLTYLVGINNSASYDGIPRPEDESFVHFGSIDCESTRQKDREEITPNTFIVRSDLFGGRIGIKEGDFDEKGPGVWYGPDNIQLRTLNE